MNLFLYLIVLLFLCLLHEAGHGFVALLFGKFKGFGIKWWGFETKLKMPVSVEEYIVIVIAGFWITLPSAIVFDLVFNMNLWVLISVFISSMDLLILWIVSNTLKTNPFFKVITEKNVFFVKMGITEREKEVKL